MSNITDIADRGLDVLHGTLTKVLMDFRHFNLTGLNTYRQHLAIEDSVKVTMTACYITNILTSGLAKLYMLRGHTHNEIDREELRTHLDSINQDMMKVKMKSYTMVTASLWDS